MDAEQPEFIDRLARIHDAMLAKDEAAVADISGANEGELAGRLQSASDVLRLIERVKRHDGSKASLGHTVDSGELERDLTRASLQAAGTHRDAESGQTGSGQTGSGQTGSGTPGPRASEHDVPRGIGRFRIERTLGQGGYGIVFLAYDPALKRRVALKIPRPEALITAELRRRFLREAEAAAALNHANVVPVFESGHAGPLCYIAYAYCQGISLQQWLREQTEPVAPDLAARVLLVLSEAIQHAHSRGVVHRDLKPSNVLIDGAEIDGAEIDGRSAEAGAEIDAASLRITDFGLAKLESDEADQTRTGSILGTPSYMSPEQADGRKGIVVPATDIYSLGAILYELLTGVPPFTGESVLETLQAVRQQQPAPPRKLRRQLPRDLESICLKCLEKQPAARYRSATELADDLQRFLGREPVRARHFTRTERFVRWCRQNPLAAGLVCLSSLFLATVVLGSLQLRSQRDAALEHLKRAEEAEARSTQSEQLAQRRLFESLMAQAKVRRLSAAVGGRSETLSTLEEASRLVKSLQLGPDKVDQLRNEAVACLGDLRSVEYVDWPRLEVAVTSLAAAPHQAYLALGLADGTLSLCSLPGGEPLARWRPHDSEIRGLSFNASGTLLVSGDASGVVKCWEIDDIGHGRPVQEFSAHPQIVSLVVSADGEKLAVGSFDAMSISIWSPCTGDHLDELSVDGLQLGAASLSPDGRLLAGRYYDNGEHGLAVWHMGSQQPARRLRSPVGEVNDVAFSPDASLLAFASDDGVAVVETSEFEQRLVLPGELSHSVTFSSDGRQLAVGCTRNGVARIYDVQSGQELLTLENLEGHPNAVHADFWSGGVVSAAGRSVRIWDLSGSPEKRVLAGHAGGVTSVEFSPASRLLVSASKDKTVKLWNPQTGKRIATLTGFREPVQTAAMSPDGKWLATGDWSGQLELWSLEDPRTPCRAKSLQHELGTRIWSVRFSPDGNYLGASGHGMAVWRITATDEWPTADRINLEEVPPPPEHSGTTNLLFSPRTPMMACVLGNCGLELWDLNRSRTMGMVPVRLVGNIASMAFTPDGQLVFVEEAGNVCVWDAGTNQVVKRFGNGQLLRAETQGVIAVSGDGQLLAIQDQRSSAVSIWSLAGQQRVFTLPEDRGTVWVLSWNPVERALAVGRSDGRLLIWSIDEIQDRLNELGLSW